MAQQLENRCIDNSPHDMVFLKSSDVFEIGYRKWAHEDTFYCKKCLIYKTIEVEHKERARVGSW